MTDMDEAIAEYRRLVLIPAADDVIAEYLQMLVGCLQARYLRVGARQDIDDAIEYGRQLIRRVAPESPIHANALTVLAISLCMRFRMAAITSDLEEAAELAESAARMAGEGPHAAPLHANVAMTWLEVAHHDGSLAKLQAAVQHARSAVVVSSSEDDNLGLYLYTLVCALRALFDRTGSGSILDEAIDMGRQAVTRLADREEVAAQSLHALGTALRLRYEYTGSRPDLTEAAEILRRAVSLSSHGDVNRPTILAECCTVLYVLAESFGADTLDESVHLAREAVDSAARSDANLGRYCFVLSTALMTRWQNALGSEPRADAEGAVAAAVRAVKVTPVEDSEYGKYLAHLGTAFVAWYRATGELKSLESGIRLLVAGVNRTPVGHPGRAGRLSDLGSALAVYSSVRHDAGAMDTALAAWREAAGSDAAPVVTRLTSAHLLATVLAASSGHEQALAAYAGAVELLALLAWPGLTVDDQLDRLRNHAQLVSSEGASCAVAGMANGTAVEMLEHGRNLYWQQMLSRRGDLDLLRESQPEIAERLRRCRLLLDTVAAV
ncbi:hypothetical protein CS0771_62530 [Catellatospora sp. IY07-71]|uniref:hypothetical protein n=1 Tax=Catellatospora sp. IY07-71 TaxID=2728827 RepID=UPI001BB3D206|nr:hypothetical protein [Catellatospora sp. IY07-71]BCJ76709.1 hypothetical protein CS0771_62530 [Catellatospora sp. IY07-71]